MNWQCRSNFVDSDRQATSFRSHQKSCVKPYEVHQLQSLRDKRGRFARLGRNLLDRVGWLFQVEKRLEPLRLLHRGERRNESGFRPIALLRPRCRRDGRC